MFRLRLSRAVCCQYRQTIFQSPSRPLITTITNLQAKINKLNQACVSLNGTKNLSSILQTRTLVSLEQEQEPDSLQKKDDHLDANTIMRRLDIQSTYFEQKVVKLEIVDEKDFIRFFEVMRRAFNDLKKLNKLDNLILRELSLCSSLLLKCCGELMLNVEPKTREIHAGKLWNFIKTNDIPIDITHYNGLLKTLNENGSIIDPQKILEEMTEVKINPDRLTYQRLIQQYCIQGNIKSATGLLERMRDLEMDLNETIFAHLITGYFKQDNPPTISEIFELMRQNNIEPGNKSYSAAICAVVKQMKTNPEATKDFEELYEMIKEEQPNFGIEDIVNMISVLQNEKSNSKVMDLLNSFVETRQKTRSRFYHILYKLINIGEYELASKMYWKEDSCSKNSARASTSSHYIKALILHGKNVPAEFIMNEAKRMEENNHQHTYQILFYHAAEYKNADISKLAAKKLEELYGFNVIVTWPLIVQCNDDSDLVKVLEEFLPSDIPKEDLVSTFSEWVWPRFADNYQRLFDLVQHLNYDKSVLMRSLIKFGLGTDRMSSIVKFLEAAPQEFISSFPDRKQEDRVEGQEEEDEDENLRGMRWFSKTNNRFERRLVKSLIDEVKDPALVHKIIELCNIDLSRLRPTDVSGLVSKHLENDDFDRAFEQFKYFVEQRRLLVFPQSLIAHCLKKKDTENLQKIIDIASKIEGESHALFELAVACIECGKVKQAEKILAQPGYRVSPQRVYGTSKKFARDHKIDELEAYTSLVRDMYDINQEVLYEDLIRACDQVGDGQRLLRVWQKMQEDELQPSKRNLIHMATVLKRHNISVPFQVPTKE